MPSIVCHARDKACVDACMQRLGADTHAVGIGKTWVARTLHQPNVRSTARATGVSDRSTCIHTLAWSFGSVLLSTERGPSKAQGGEPLFDLLLMMSLHLQAPVELRDRLIA